MSLAPRRCHPGWVPRGKGVSLKFHQESRYCLHRCCDDDGDGDESHSLFYTRYPIPLLLVWASFYVFSADNRPVYVWCEKLKCLKKYISITNHFYTVKFDCFEPLLLLCCFSMERGQSSSSRIYSRIEEPLWYSCISPSRPPMAIGWGIITWTKQ